MNPNEFPELRSFFNEKEQIIAMPAKRKKLLLAVYYLSDKIESGRDYTESEINDLLDGWTTFLDIKTPRLIQFNYSSADFAA